MANDSFYTTSFAPTPTADSFYTTSFTPVPPAESFYTYSATITQVGSCFHRTEAILGVSSDFIAAWENSSIEAKAKVIIEFGNNRFNDNAVITASSTKTVDRIDPFVNANFWKASDVFNNKERQTVNWMVCDQGIKADAGYRVVDINNTEAEKGWWSANKSNGSGVFTSPEWVMSTFDPRYMNRIRLFLMEGYSNMSNVTVQYYNHTTSTWVDAATNFTLSPITFDYTWDISQTLVSGLRVYVNNTLSINDYARISELQGLLVLDVSEQIVSCDVNAVREEYEGTVPVGTTRSNTFSLELENIDQILSPDNTDDSVYAQYMAQDNRVEVYYGIKTGPSTYEYVQMGEFWTDEWQIDGGGVTARTSGRDFSKFLQDDRITIGRVWLNKTVGEIFRDIMQLMGFGISRIDIDPNATREFSITYIKDESIWSFMSQIAFADQGMFGFGRDGRFYYHSYNRLNTSPYYNISYDYDENRNIIDGQLQTMIYTNKVTVNVTPVNLADTGIRSIWGAEDPTILSWNTLASSITDSQTTITLSQNANDANNLQYYLPEKNGFVYIGTELIKYGLRGSNLLSDCIRGYSGTVAAAHSTSDYVGEARLWNIEYDNYPAINIQSPYITAIDGRLNEGQSALAKLVVWQQDAFTAKLVIANQVQGKTYLEGTGPSFDDPDHLPWFTVIAGQVPIEESGREKIGIDAEDGPENAVAIRKWGKNQIDIDNKWIQDKNHAIELAENIIEEYSTPRKIVELNTFPYPALDLGLRVYIANYEQLSIEGKEYHIIALSYRFDGGLSCAATLRETLESSNRRRRKEHNVDCIIDEVAAPSLTPPIEDWVRIGTNYTKTINGNSIELSNNTGALGFAGINVGYVDGAYGTVDQLIALTPSNTFNFTATMTTSLTGGVQLGMQMTHYDSSFNILGTNSTGEIATAGVPEFIQLNNSSILSTPPYDQTAWVAIVLYVQPDSTTASTFLIIDDPNFEVN